MRTLMAVGLLVASAIYISGLVDDVATAHSPTARPVQAYHPFRLPWSADTFEIGLAVARSAAVATQIAERMWVSTTLLWTFRE